MISIRDNTIRYLQESQNGHALGRLKDSRWLVEYDVDKFLNWCDN